MCKEEIHEILDSPGLSNEDKSAVLNSNAQAFYRLTPVGSNGK
jgi:hypothetical protein